MKITTMSRGIVISTVACKGGSMFEDIIVEGYLIDSNLLLTESPFYRDSVWTEELHENKIDKI